MAFPSELVTFIPRIDNVHTVLAADVNSLQQEVTLLETVLGTGVLTSAYDSTAWSFVSTNLSLADRLNNIERGLINGVPNSPYIQSSITVQGTVGITVSSGTGNTTNLIETYDPSNSLGFNIDYAGYPYVSGNPVIYFNSPEYGDILTYVDNAVAVVTGSAGVNPLLIAGM